jgi:hypothetical protein
MKQFFFSGFHTHKIYGDDKVLPLSKHNVTGLNRESGNKGPSKLYPRQRCGVSVTHQLLGGLQKKSCHSCGRDKNSCPFLESNPSCPTYRLSLY